MGTVAHEMGMRLQTYFNKKIQFSFLINDVGSNTLREPLKQIQLQLIMSSLSPGHALSKLNGNTVPPAKFRFSRHLKEFHQTPLHKPDILQLTFASHLYLSIYHCTSAHHQYSTCLITCAQSLYSIINFQLTLSAFITNSPVQIEMITSPSALKTLKQVRTMK